MIKIFKIGNNLALEFPYNEFLLMKVRSLPQRRWDKKRKIWKFKPLIQNLKYVLKWFDDAEWSEEAIKERDAAFERQSYRDKISSGEIKFNDDLTSVPFAYPPYKHQKTALLMARDIECFAYFMEQGTGKTKVLIDDASHQWRNNKIDALLVICPNGVKTNWVDPFSDDDEVAKHMPPDVPFIKGCWFSNPRAAERNKWEEFQKQSINCEGLKILSINIDAIRLKRVYEILKTFVTTNKTMIVIDESTKIKRASTSRSKAAFKLRQFCPFARIMSGTPIVKSPLNAFSQFKFLDEEILGFSTFTAFRSHFADMGGYEGYQVIRYKNIDELSNLVAGSSYRIIKKNCLDLPAKIYPPARKIKMTTTQRQLYDDMRDKCIVDLKELGSISATHVLSKLLRLQQITSGFLPILDDAGQQIDVMQIDKSSPKTKEVMNIIDECDEKIIIWCRFRSEIEVMVNEFKKEKIQYVEYHGGINITDRNKNKKSFQNDPSIKIFIGTAASGGMGIDLFAASTVIFLSNTFDTEDRMQAEDRAHRIGQHNPVTYIDLVCPGTIDTKIISVLRQNKKLSDVIMKDGYQNWI